jgi:hypothetical protein
LFTSFVDATNSVGARLAREAFSYPNPFQIAHHFVTERPSVAQNHAQVTAIILAQKIPSKNFISRKALDLQAYSPSKNFY